MEGRRKFGVATDDFRLARRTFLKILLLVVIVCVENGQAGSVVSETGAMVSKFIFTFRRASRVMIFNFYRIGIEYLKNETFFFIKVIDKQLNYKDRYNS